MLQYKVFVSMFSLSKSVIFFLSALELIVAAASTASWCSFGGHNG